MLEQQNNRITTYIGMALIFVLMFLWMKYATPPTTTEQQDPNAAPTETATSGALVPNATMVSPTTKGEMRKDKANLDAPRTSKSAPATKASRPAINVKKVMAIQHSCLVMDVYGCASFPGGDYCKSDAPSS